MGRLVAKTLKQALQWWPEIDLGYAKDWTWYKFNYLTCIYRTKGNNSNTYWVCKCDCGNYISCDLTSLKKENTISCGCIRRKCKGKPNQIKNLQGKNIYNFTVLADSGKRDDHRNVVWICRCNCEKHPILEVSSADLLSGRKTSCGCKKISKGEWKIQNILEKQNIVFKKEFCFQDCKYIKELPFDFYLPKYNICIEYDGEQHYKNIDFFGGEDALKKRQKLDNIKTNYCKENNIKLIRIPYTDFNILNKDYLLTKIGLRNEIASHEIYKLSSVHTATEPE